MKELFLIDKVGPFPDIVIVVTITSWSVMVVIVYCWTMINVVVSMGSNYQVCVTILKICFIICIMVRCCEHLSPQTETLRPGELAGCQGWLYCIMRT